MVNINIDLEGPRNGEIISEKMLKAVTEGCRKTLRMLGLLGLAIKTFEVVFLRFDGYLEPGPRIKVIFQDPLGNESSYTTGHGLIEGDLTAERIALTLCSKNCLPFFIGNHLRGCPERIEEAQAQLKVWMPDEKKPRKRPRKCPSEKHFNHFFNNGGEGG